MALSDEDLRDYIDVFVNRLIARIEAELALEGVPEEPAEA